MDISEVIPAGEVNTPALQRFNSNLKKTEIGINCKILVTFQSEPIAPNFGENVLRGNKISKGKNLLSYTQEYAFDTRIRAHMGEFDAAPYCLKLLVKESCKYSFFFMDCLKYLNLKAVIEEYS